MLGPDTRIDTNKNLKKKTFCGPNTLRAEEIISAGWIPNTGY